MNNSFPVHCKTGNGVYGRGVFSCLTPIYILRIVLAKANTSSCDRSATSWILNALGGCDNQYPRFSSYVFSDISAGFFEKAQTKFKAWGDLISYRSLNIEKDLKAQGFDENEGYDIIAAANILHATGNMKHTMTQVHKLLKPGGKLVLVEATTCSRISLEFVFGLLPGWWLGKQEIVIESSVMLTLFQAFMRGEKTAHFYQKSSGPLC